MYLFDTIRTALIALASNKMRTVLTMLGVIIGVGSVVILLSIGEGVQQFVTGRITSLGTNVLTVQPDQRTPNARLTDNDLIALSNPLDVPDATVVVGVVSNNARVSIGTQNRNTSVSGTTPEFFAVRNIGMDQGEVFSQESVNLRVREAVLGSSISEALFGKGAAAVGQTVIINNAPFRVVGVAESKGGFGPGGNTDDTVYVPLTVAQEKLFVFRGTGLRSLNTIYVEMRAADVATQTTEDIAAVLRREHHLLAAQVDDFRISNPAEFANTLQSVTTGLTIFLGSVGAISLLVGGIGIMNIMLVSVTERTREIGLRKAIGARRSAIMTQFLIEAIVVSALAGLIGVLFGVSVSMLAGPAIANGLQAAFTPTVQPQALGIAFGFAALVGVVFGLYPAWRASRLLPVEALRYE